MVVSFIGGGNWSSRRKPPTCRNILTKKEHFFVTSMIVIQHREKHFPDKEKILFLSNRIGGVMVRVLASNVVELGYEPRSSQTKDYEIGICFFSAKRAA